MNKLGLLIAILAFTLVSCTNQNKKKNEETTTVEETIIDSHTSEISLDWAGVYSGVLPCADCPGIVTEISLYRDSTYELKTLYLGQGEEDAEFIEHGEFEWSEDGNHITLKNTEKSQYKIGENQIWALDSNGNVVMGDMEKLYILHKKN